MVVYLFKISILCIYFAAHFSNATALRIEIRCSPVCMRLSLNCATTDGFSNNRLLTFFIQVKNRKFSLGYQIFCSVEGNDDITPSIRKGFMYS